jgi:hypothetical protein
VAGSCCGIIRGVPNILFDRLQKNARMSHSIHLVNTVNKPRFNPRTTALLLEPIYAASSNSYTYNTIRALVYPDNRTRMKITPMGKSFSSQYVFCKTNQPPVPCISLS